jgi:hypothetical protein
MIWSTERGLFTRALIEGLEGNAVTLVDGRWVVTCLSLYAYVETRLDELVKEQRLKGSQHLSWNPAGVAKDIELAQLSEPPRLTLKVVAPNSTSVEIYDKRNQRRETKMVDDGVVEFELEPGMYRLAGLPDDTGDIIDVRPGRRMEVVLR